MNTASIVQLHGVDRIETQLMCLNGRWQRKIKIVAGTHEMDITLYGSENANLEPLERAPQYVHVEDYEPRVDRSDKPFESASAAKGDLNG